MVAVLCAGATAYSVLQSLAVPALGTLQRELHTTAGGVSWVLTSYLLSASVLTPVIGRLGDLHGKRRAMVGALVALAAGAALSALAHSLPVMLAGRLVQGAGGAVFPLAFAMIRDNVPSESRARAIAAVSAVLSIGGALGTLAAGPILHLLSYHWLFWIPAGLSLVAAGLTAVIAPESGRKPGAGRIGALSVLLFATWLALLLLAITDLSTGHPVRSVTLAGAAALLAVIWGRRELRTTDPLVDLRTLWRPELRATNAATLLLGLGMFAAWMLGPLLLQQDPATGAGFGLPATAVGFYLLPTAAGTLVVTPLVGRFRDTSGWRSALFTGAMITAVAYGWLAFFHQDRVNVLLGLFLEGCGIGLAFAAVAIRTVGEVPPDQTGVVTGVNTIMRTVGGTLGTNLAGALLATVTTTGGEPADAAYTIAFAVFGLALLACAGIALLPARSNPDLRYARSTVPAVAD
ncbi:MFS transporter [Actinoplanes ianthinogenes]|uniref:MFS transporter n=1 Tax=Actinoplanes ianthinogenes TaxID=122358 RepID=A0ABM7M6N8_9ACTN|nr:MFS transporter [Actinoplanes ianthinogenes]BCJ47246.1 MFS transporter [Actinoplanes ianthinogenes]GGR42499.1 MFS transporter [Actinoplanes ianthinogenes]